MARIVVVVAVGAALAALEVIGVSRANSASRALSSDADREGSAAPEFPAGLEWIQSKPLKLADLRGQVVVVQFWTNGCINCIHNYPVYRSWYDKYGSEKLKIIGVHTPEFAWEVADGRVEKKARENSLKFPIVVDPASNVWKEWNNHYWPSIYLVDKRGKIRATWEGELHLDTADGKAFAARIDALLAEKP